MKKFLVVLITLLFAAGAFAQEAAKAEKKGPEFKYGFYGLGFYDNTSSNNGREEEEYSYAHVRVKPSFSIGNENVKGVVVFEIDQDLGASPKTRNERLSSDVARTGADAGTDNKDVEVKHAYFQVKDMIIPGLTTTVGLFGYYSALLIDNDFGMGQASIDLMGMGSLNFTYLPTQEGYLQNHLSNTSQDSTTGVYYTGGNSYSDDVKSYAVDATVKAGPISIKPAYIYTQFGNENITVSKADDEAKHVAATTYDEDAFSFADGSMWNAGLISAAKWKVSDLMQLML